MATWKQYFIDHFNIMSEEVYNCAKEKGWWDNPRNDGEAIALMHSELSEALEGLRKGNPRDDMLRELSSVEVELADVIIRIMDYAEGNNLDIARAIVAKHEYNLTRPRKHGGKKF
jgi:NTP pyrophosphatase (non-canonical NTP hydrolase)